MPEQAAAWVLEMQRAAAGGVDPAAATMVLAEYGALNMTLALRGLEAKTTDPYRAGWKKRVVPTIGHIPVRMVTYGAVDRAVLGWIADGCGKSTVKNSLAILVRVMEQAYRDGIVDRNPARITGWQRQYHRAEDELANPRALALPNWAALTRLTDALVTTQAATACGERSSSSPPAPARGSARYRAAGSATSSGAGPFDARPHRDRADSWTRAPRGNAPGKYR
jgi:hypothetical protein